MTKKYTSADVSVLVHKIADGGAYFKFWPIGGLLIGGGGGGGGE